MTIRQTLLWSTAVVLSGSLWLGPAVHAQPPARALIVDTDAGDDDLMALAFLLARPDVRIEAITISFGLAHQKPGAQNVLRLLDFAGRADVPVHLGRDTPGGAHTSFPEAWRTRSDLMAGLTLPPSKRSPDKQPAVDYLAARLRDRSRPVDLLVLGAQTNIAEVLERQSALAAVRSVVIMGGAVDVPGNVNGTNGNTTAEWNLFADPGAARRVLSSGLSMLMVPLDATNAVHIDAAFVREVQQRAATPLGRVVAGLLAAVSSRVDAGTYYAWDPLAAAALVDPSIVRSERLSVGVRVTPPEDGRTVRDQQGPRIGVALGADQKGFLDLFLTTLARRSGP